VKKIPCEGLDSLKDMEAHGKMLAYIGKYKKRSALGSLLAIVFASIAILTVAQAYILVFAISLVAGDVLRNALTPGIGELLSGAASDILLNGVFWVAEAVIIFPFLIVAFAFVLLFYYSAKSISSKQPNVARALYLVDTLKEAENLTLNNKASQLGYRVLKHIWDKSAIGRNKANSIEDMSKEAYANGAVISETDTKTLPFTAASSHPSSKGKLRVELKEHGDLMSMVVFIGTEGSTDWLPEVIAIFDKKYTKEIVGKIASCCPSAVIV
jgi:hypothetical protein